MIRLGLAGRLRLRGSTCARRLDTTGPAGVYAILYKPEPDTKVDKYAVIYVDHADDLSAERFPFNHPRASCWIRRAGDRFKLYICYLEVPGGLALASRADRPRVDGRLPPRLQPRSVRPGVEGRVDRRVHRTHRRPAHHRSRPLTAEVAESGGDLGLRFGRLSSVGGPVADAVVQP